MRTTRDGTYAETWQANKLTCKNLHPISFTHTKKKPCNQTFRVSEKVIPRGRNTSPDTFHLLGLGSTKLTYMIHEYIKKNWQIKLTNSSYNPNLYATGVQSIRIRSWATSTYTPYIISHHTTNRSFFYGTDGAAHHPSLVYLQSLVQAGCWQRRPRAEEGA
jgi:hypothetical protein